MKRSKGITLIELLIVVAIVGILAAVAAPSYREYILRGEYSAAQQALMGLAQAMEQHYAQNLTYTGASNASTDVPSVYVSWAPSDGPESAKKYNLTAEVINSGNGYTLRATSTTNANHWFQYTSVGVKSWQLDTGTAYSGCWNKRDC